MQVILVSIIFIVLANPAQTRAKEPCADDHPAWCYDTFKEVRNHYLLPLISSHLISYFQQKSSVHICLQFSNYCHKMCGICKSDYDPATAKDPCDCDGVNCVKAHDCGWYKLYTSTRGVCADAYPRWCSNKKSQNRA